MKLTDQQIRLAKSEPGKRLELRDSIEPGLVLRVTPAGGKSWSVRYRTDEGEQRRLNLGTYPGVGLARARELARKAKGDISVGTDVVGDRQQKKTEARLARLNTISGLAESYFAAASEGTHRGGAVGRPKRASTIGEERRIFAKLVEPELGGVAVAKLTKAEIRDYVTEVTKTSPANGRHVRNIIRQMLSYAVTVDLVPANVALGISAPASGQRDRVLSEDELKALWVAFEKPETVEGLTLARRLGLALRIACVTLQRRGEVMGLRRSEVDLEAKTWTIPASRMKGKRPHLVPLSDLAVSLMREAFKLSEGREMVFGTMKEDGIEVPPDTHALSRAMKKVVDSLGLPSATPHDLRRTGATMLTSEALGFPRFVVSQILAHSSDGGGAAAVTGIYDRNSYLPQKRQALDAWAAHIDRLVTGKAKPTNVVKMSRSKRV